MKHSALINVADALNGLPHFDTFCSVAKLHDLAERLGADPRFKVQVAGKSRSGQDIHHLRFGSSEFKALFVAFPHCHEPIGGLTVYSLLTLLSENCPTLLSADVEWHIVPCIDPDGALLNEGWTQQSYDIRNHMRNFYLQPPCDQVDVSFPVQLGKLSFDRPSAEAAVLRSIIDAVRPDFFFSLHNSNAAGGNYFYSSQKLGKFFSQQLFDLLSANDLPLLTQTPSNQYCEKFSPGIEQLPSLKSQYTFFENHIPDHYLAGGFGASSQDYATEINPEALVFVAELSYGKHPFDISLADSGQTLRQLKRELDAENRALAKSLIESWDKAVDDLDSTSPLYAKLQDELIACRHVLDEEMPITWSVLQKRDIASNPTYDAQATECDKLREYVLGRFRFLCHGYSFVRLLEASEPTLVVQEVRAGLERLFHHALDDFCDKLDFAKHEPVPCDTLAKVQLGSGLIALNSVLARRAGGASDKYIAGWSVA